MKQIHALPKGKLYNCSIRLSSACAVHGCLFLLQSELTCNIMIG
jgi:hypothetical protein